MLGNWKSYHVLLKYKFDFVSKRHIKHILILLIISVLRFEDFLPILTFPRYHYLLPGHFLRNSS